jgi:GT2 family glycosyltransferase
MGDNYRLDQQASQRVTDEVLASGEFVNWAPPAEKIRLLKRRLKAWWHTLIGHPDKPRLIGNNMGIWRSDLEAVNGFDEKFIGWGCEDDDMTLRLRQTGVQIKSILRWTRIYHLWHPVDPSAPKRAWRDGPNVAYLHRPHRPAYCQEGLNRQPCDRSHTR